MRLHTLIAFLVFLLIIGCIKPTVGLKTEDKCPPLRDSERISCWHQVAVSEAYRENADAASGFCGYIWDDVGAAHVTSGKKDDVAIKAESERNLCYYDIAKIIARQTSSGGQSVDMSQYALNLCNNIQQDNYSSTLAGAAVTQDMCYREVNRTANIRPENYYSNPNNICSIIFVVPLVLIAVFRKRD